MKNAPKQDAQNEGLPLDPNAFATKLDLADFKSELKDAMTSVRVTVERLEERVNMWGKFLWL